MENFPTFFSAPSSSSLQKPTVVSGISYNTSEFNGNFYRLPLFPDVCGEEMGFGGDDVVSERRTGFDGIAGNSGKKEEVEKKKMKEEEREKEREYKREKTRRQRYAFQTRSQVDILDDGYRWRKYGQKAVKNNKFPRSYYRCTQQGCRVKKQVQRLTRDEGVVVTTYEGIHSHPIQKSTDNFDHILSQMQIYPPF